ncbi:uncharacterized protein [Ptychodera flava]|uniref:uncharacterized protein isoform X6 n=1 Tax=Ptychodera flava TaxID=63121 RepID=UPI00396A0D83
MYPHRHIAMVTLMLAVFGSFHFSLGQDATPTTCQSLQSSICALQVNYTQTHFPNFVGHEHPNDAELQLQTFTPLIQFGCSEYLPQFLCAVFYPYCDSNGVKLPCQSVCHIVYDGCMPVLESFGFPWPSAMDCSLFPTQQGCFSVDTTTTKPIPAITSPEVPVIELSTVKPTQNTNVPSMVCEPLLSEKCLAYVNYNYTTYPNYFGNSDWRSADTTLRDMTFILQMQCSDYLPLFMCSVIHPKCADQSIVPPCQSLCQDVYDGCNSVFAQFDVEWPEYLDCSQFPSSEDSGDCVKISISEPEEPATPQCETVTLEMCGDFYNGTSLPNSVGHTRQSEVSEMMTQSFQAFASLGCSEYFSLLLCSMYLPKCDKNHGVMKPCQSLCQRVKDDCQAMLDSAGVPFPMDCEMTFLFSTESSPHCVSVDSISPSALPAPSDQCETVTLEMCGDFYNGTSLPNSIGHTTQSEVSEMMESFQIFASFGCSEYFLLLLCSMYLPKCDKSHGVMKPCQSLCQRVKDDCQAALDSAGVPFPMDCEMTFLFSTESSPHCVSVDSISPSALPAPGDQCETVTLEMCGDFYNGTSLPNSIGHTTQSEVSEMMESFQIFASFGCSEYFLLLLCSMYLPKCDKNHGVMKPCQSLCQRVKDDCQAMLDSAGVPFPMDCEMTFLFSTESPPHCVSVDYVTMTTEQAFSTTVKTVSITTDQTVPTTPEKTVSITTEQGLASTVHPGCPDPGTVENGLISTNSGALTFPAVPGSQLTFICKDGFSLVGTPVSVCKFDSSWSLPLPQCIADCSDPGTPAHGYQIGTPSYQAYTTVSFNCDHGYQLAGAHIITCNDGVWSHTLPVCTGVQTSGVETTASSQSGDTQQPITDQNDKEQTSRRGYIRCTAERESDSYCLNGGTCFQLTVDGVQEQQCICHGNFTGKRCQERVLTDAERSRQEQADKKRNIAIGVGIGIACLVVLAIVIVLIIFCRKQMRHKTHYFSSRPDSAVFTNPAYDDVTLTRKDAESYPKDNEGFKEEDLLESKNKNLSAEPYREPSDKVIENKLSESDEIHPVPFCEPVEDEPASPGSDSSKVKGQSPTAIDNPSYQTFQYPYQDDTVIDKLKVDKF